MVRAFVAIDINEAVRQRLVSVQDQLAATGAKLKLVEPSNIHVTMKFLGDVSEDGINAVVEALRKSAEGKPRFDIDVSGIGVFPNPRYVKVVWAGVKRGKDEITDLHRSVDCELQPLGFRPERDFVPHLTIARVKTVGQREKFAAFLKEMANVDFGSTRAEAVELKQSKLTQEGPIYSTLARIELG